MGNKAERVDNAPRQQLNPSFDPVQMANPYGGNPERNEASVFPNASYEGEQNVLFPKASLPDDSGRSHIHIARPSKETSKQPSS